LDRLRHSVATFLVGWRELLRAQQRRASSRYSVVLHLRGVADLFDVDLLDDEDPFEVDEQAAHLFKHVGLGIEDILDVWRSDPLFYPAKPPAH